MEHRRLEKPPKIPEVDAAIREFYGDKPDVKVPTKISDDTAGLPSDKHALMLEIEALARAEGLRDLPLELKINPTAQADIDNKATIDQVVANDEEVPLSFLTASRLVATDASKNLESIDLASMVTGGAGITVTDNGDGTITISLT